MSDSNTPKNPYASYVKQAQSGISQREKEGQLLIKSAQALQGLVDNWTQAQFEDIEIAISYNQSLWTLFFERAEAGRDKTALSKTIISLGHFVFQRSAQILAEQDSDKRKSMFDALINVNKQIASGLFKKF
jgi:flagellar biosynthesis regulator FlaF